MRRSDGFIAYHLATVIDELTLGITEVVRGDDLLDVMPSQLALVDALEQPALTYKHAPLFCDSEGRKLAKRDGQNGIAGLKEQGMSSSEVIGFLASSLGLVGKGMELTAEDLLVDLKRQRNSLELLINQ